MYPNLFKPRQQAVEAAKIQKIIIPIAAITERIAKVLPLFIFV